MKVYDDCDGITEDQDMKEPVTVRLHGHVKIDPRWLTDVTLAKSHHHPPPVRRSFFGMGAVEQSPSNAPSATDSLLPNFTEFHQENMACTLSTLPVVLSPPHLTKGQVMTYRFSVALPSRLLPSFRGLGARFLYAVSVSIGSRTHAHIPITILSNGFLGESQGGSPNATILVGPSINLIIVYHLVPINAL